ncbi:MAG: hypothetical protein Q8769_02055, partial [Candidatus Phytoplasma australasiaticum]|nr:hypothetical protein [Candidatus Phytoplasma australasiaticum]
MDIDIFKTKLYLKIIIIKSVNHQDQLHIEPPALQALADRAALRDQKERLEKELKQLKTQQAVAADRAA